MIVFALLLLAADADEATRAEAQAFADVQAKRWCDAVNGFMRANELAPADELVFNAALAAEHGGDVARAMELFARVPASSSKGDSAQRHLKELAKARQTVTCAERPPANVAVEPSGAPTGTAVGSAIAPAGGSDAANVIVPDDAAPASATAVDAPESMGRPALRDEDTGFGVAPLGVIGAGGVVFVVSAVALALGASTYFEHESANAAILDAQQRGADPKTLTDEHASLAQSRLAWESWGVGAVVGGVAGMILGAGAVAGGAAMWMVSE